MNRPGPHSVESRPSGNDFRYFRRPLWRTACCLAVVLSGIAAFTTARADFSLNILHINDLHSRLQPVNTFNAACEAQDDARGECFGGIARVKTLIDTRRDALSATGEAVLVLDAGDQFQGSLFHTTYQGAASAEFMNAIGFDAMAVGNHEFDNGPEVLSRFIDSVEFPLIGTNIDVSRSAPLSSRIAPYTVIERNGVSIGIIGAVAEDTAETSSPGPDVTFTDTVPALTRAVRQLEAIGIDKIIALTHVGLGRDRVLARTVPGIDVVVGGHTHSLLGDFPDAAGPYPILETGATGNLVPVVQAYAYSRVVGELRVVFDDAGNVMEATGTPHVLDASVTPDTAVAARVAELAQPFETLVKKVVGRLPRAVSADGCRAGECEMGNLVADAMLERVRSQGIDIALTNGGSIRASLDAGDVTLGDVLTMLPFQNTLSTFVIDGSDLVAALENGVSRAEEGAGRFPQVAGLRFSWLPDAPAGQRVDTVEVNAAAGWERLDTAREYRMVSNDYLRRGGDGYSMLRDNARDAYDFGPGVEEVVSAFLADHPDYEARLDGRISAHD